jgi:hypothetical protein
VQHEKPFESSERRRHKRLAMTGNPLAVMRPAPSRPGKLLRISDESAEIIYCQINDSCEAATDEIDILVPDFTRGLFLERISVKTVADLPDATSVAGADGYERMRKRVVIFGKLTPDQIGQLQSFICSCAG